jgi:hypothetical protein
MQKTIDTADFRERIDVMLEELEQEQNTYVLTREGKPLGVLLSYGEYTRLFGSRERDVIDSVDEMLSRMSWENARYSDDEVDTDVAAAQTRDPS